MKAKKGKPLKHTADQESKKGEKAQEMTIPPAPTAFEWREIGAWRGQFQNWVDWFAILPVLVIGLFLTGAAFAWLYFLLNDNLQVFDIGDLSKFWHPILAIILLVLGLGALKGTWNVLQGYLREDRYEGPVDSFEEAMYSGAGTSIIIRSKNLTWDTHGTAIDIDAIRTIVQPGTLVKIRYGRGSMDIREMWVYVPVNTKKFQPREDPYFNPPKDYKQIPELKTGLWEKLVNQLKVNPFTLLRKSFVSVSLIVVYATLWMSGLFKQMNWSSETALISAGALFDPLLAKGEHWRVFTSIFVVRGWLYTVLLVMLLITTGALIERSMGHIRFLSVFIMSGVSGSLFGAYVQPFTLQTAAFGACSGVIMYQLIISIFIKGKHHNLLKLAWMMIPVPAIFIFGSIFIITIVPVEWAPICGGIISGIVISVFTLILQGRKNIHQQTLRELLVMAILFAAITTLIVAFPADRYRYYQNFNHFMNFLQITQRMEPSRGLLYTFTEFVKIYDDQKTTWQEFRETFKPEEIVNIEMKNDMQKLDKYSHDKIKALSYYIKGFSTQEFEYLDSAHDIDPSLPLLKYLRISALKDTAGKYDKKTEKKIYYVDENYNFSDERYAIYKWVVYEDSLGMKQDHADEYYQIKPYKFRLKMCGSFYNDVKHGIFRTYYKNGQLKSIGYYHEDRPDGIWKYFYEDGKADEIIVYRNDTAFLMECYSNKGDTLVHEGNGLVITFFENEVISDSGQYKNGLKDGNWAGHFESGDPYYKEKYRNGILLIGVSHSVNGEIYYYDKLHEKPFPKFNRDYNQYINENLVYPDSARLFRIEGVIKIAALIDSSGNVVNADFTNRLGYGCEQEAVRLVKNSPPFVPARYRGQIMEDVLEIKVPFRLN